VKTVPPACILGTASLLPGPPRATQEIASLLVSPRDPVRCEEKTGIRTRHWAEEGADIVPFAVEVLRGALADAKLAATDLARIILTCSTGGDVMFPATAALIAAELGLDGTCDAFDLNNACMGFLSALDIAWRSVATGLGPVAIVSVELASRGIHTGDHKPYLVFGDAAAAVIVGAAPDGADPQQGVLATFLGNDASTPDDIFVETPQLTGGPEFLQILRTSAESTAIVMRALRAGLEGLFARTNVALGDIEWIIPHQGNGVMLKAIIAWLKLDPARVVRVVEEIGGVASACVPLALDRLWKSGRVRPGDRILLAGIGGGISYGATLYRVGAT
jgi:3-oxoacyl-(acyl-carrier-protein) synthase III